MDNSKFLKLLDNYDVHCLRIIKLATVDGTETKDQQKKRVAELEKDYIKWFEFHFPQYAKRKCAWFHRKLANAIIRNKRIRCLAEIYRSGAKSVHICMGIPLYLYLVKKELNFMMLIGETDPKAKKLISGIQAELEVNPRILNDYGRRMMEGDWSDGHFITNDGVRFMSLGFNQDPRGSREGANRPDYIVIDDVDSKRHMNNDEMMAAGVDRITEDIEGCFDADSDESAIERMVYSNNNVHKNSITNRLKKEYLNNIKKDIQEGVKTDYEIITVTAVKDLVKFEPNWPEKTNSAYWRRKYNRKPKSFMREYMHTHAEDGIVFKPETMQWCKMLPLRDYDALFMYGDLSYKTEGDFKAMILCGKKGRQIHIIHTLCRQASRTDVAGWTYDLWERRNLSEANVKILIEGLFAMDEFVSDFDNEGDDRGYHIPVVADKRGKENKYTRIESIEPYFRRRWIFFNEKEKEYTDQVALYDQLIGFSKGSKLNDDGPDCLHGCIDGLNRANFSGNFKARITKRVIKNKRY